jgi:hypothetical protein
MTLSSGNRIAEHLSIGVLARAYPMARVREVLAQTGRASQRVRDLPAEVLVYYVMALGLYMAGSTGEVLRCLVEGLRWLDPARPLRLAGKAAISQGRTRLGPGPLRALWEAIAVPLAEPKSPGAFYGAWRLVALDGTILEVPDTARNAAHFGRAGAPRGTTAFPQLRLVGLVECGTHSWLHVAFGPYAASEHTLAQAVLPKLQPGMLCLADRLFTTFPLWQQAVASGAQLLWRARRNLRLPVEEELADGSYLSTLYPSQKARDLRAGGLRVRVLDYHLQGVEGAEPFYRLLTTLLDPVQAPAQELIALYPQRWEVEGAFDELKTHLRGGRVVLRSKTPALIEQEVYGLLLAHRAVRQLIYEAAQRAQLDPDQLSFTHTLHVLRRKLAHTPALSP